MAEAQQVSGGYHVTVKIPDVDPDMLFYSFTPPSGSLDTREFKTWDAKGLPVNSIGGGRQVTWSPVQLSRGIDEKNALWDWFNTVREKGATKETKKEITIEVKSEDGETVLHTWSLTGAVITDYSHSAANAQTNEVLVQNVTLKYEDAKLEPGG
jgi:T4-like virus tail tube protein gp19